MPDHQQDVAKVAEMVRNAGLCMLTTTTEDGRLVSRPMAVQETETDGDLWFFLDEGSDTVSEVRRNAQVNAAFSNPKDSEWVSMSGTAEVVKDRAKAEELFTKPVETWFPDGVDTPGLVLLKVHADTAEIWDASDSTLKQVLGMVKAIRKDDPDEFPSENRTVEL